MIMYCPCGSLPNELGRFWAATGSKAKARYCDLGESDALGAHMGWANKTLLRVQYCTWSWLLCSKITREAQAYGTIASKNLHMLAVHVARLAHGDESGAHLGVRKPPARPRERLTATHHQTMTASHGWLLFGTVCQILATEDNNLRDGVSNPGCRRPTIYRTEKDATHRKGPGVRILQYCAVTSVQFGRWHPDRLDAFLGGGTLAASGWV